MVIIMLKISSVRHAYPENAEFCINRKAGHELFTFLHFYNSVDISINGKIMKTEPHSIILYNPDTPQYFKSKEPLIHDWFHFIGNINDLHFDTFKPDFIFYPNNYQNIIKTVAELEREFFDDKPNKNFLIDLKIKELLIKIDRDLVSDNSNITYKQYINVFRLLRGEMLSSLNYNWSVSDMAKKVNLSESHFFVLYKKFFGITPIADLINARLNNAKNMLLFKNLLIDDIATELGYNNTTHFIRQFKSLVGITPSQYRKKHQNNKP